MEASVKTSIVQTILTPGLTQLPPGLQNAHAGAKKEQHAERKPDKSQPPEWTGSVGIPVAQSNQWEGGLPQGSCWAVHSNSRPRSKRARRLRALFLRSTSTILECRRTPLRCPNWRSTTGTESYLPTTPGSLTRPKKATRTI